MKPVARRLSELGLIDPINRKLSRKAQLRCRSRGSLSIDLGKGTWCDHEANQGGGVLDLVSYAIGDTESAAIKWLERNGLLTPMPPAAGTREPRPCHYRHPGSASRIASALGLWHGASDIRGSIGESYLNGRGLYLDRDLTHALRFHKSLLLDGRATPGIVALMRDVLTNQPCGIHRTFINQEGAKLERRMLGRAKGAAIKLDSDEDVTLGLHIGEGIETCLAARQLGYHPVWALGSAGAIAAFPVLPGIEAITVFAENDNASKHAAEACGCRYESAGVEAWICEPPRGDMNDIIRRAG
jgi:Toprim domain